MTTYLRNLLSRNYPVTMLANAVACDYLRKMGQMERPVLMAAIRAEFPAVAAEVEKTYPQHVS